MQLVVNDLMQGQPGEIGGKVTAKVVDTLGRLAVMTSPPT